MTRILSLMLISMPVHAAYVEFNWDGLADLIEIKDRSGETLSKPVDKKPFVVQVDGRKCLSYRLCNQSACTDFAGGAYFRSQNGELVKCK